MQKITPFLWYSKEAEDAARLYTAIFPDSRLVRVSTLASESPSGPPGSVKIVEFDLFSQRFTAISAGSLDAFNHAVSFIVHCDDQAETFAARFAVNRIVKVARGFAVDRDERQLAHILAVGDILRRDFA